MYKHVAQGGESVLEDVDIDYKQGAYIHRHTWNKLAYISLHS